MNEIDNYGTCLKRKTFWHPRGGRFDGVNNKRYEVTRTMGGLPLVISQDTGRGFVLTYEDLISMAIARLEE